MVTVFPIIFLGELPDKTMFASLVMASRGRPLAVWLGAAGAFALHVAIAVTIGVVIFNVFPHRLVEAVVAALFLAGAAYSFAIRNRTEDTDGLSAKRSALGASAAAGAVIFLAEWGDLTQILTANLAARYHSAFDVGVAAVAALWAVAAIAVVGGTGLLRILSVRTLRIATAVVLAGLGTYTAVTAVIG
jgi:putative Ca2+/H+ antiporter (TMEM165/GDT1 family)